MKIISNKTLMEKAQVLGLNIFVTLNPDVYNWENGRPEGVTPLLPPVPPPPTSFPSFPKPTGNLSPFHARWVGG